ncbi:MAG TPA: restriction endonuclease subunit S [Rhodopirellula baltica]|uniref:Probable HsdS polypeptide, part of CfrA family n=1 Tax=Rhodopirellula baltica (strain DSM 10527 / NCIMB 13988 / SH1) TaxID=243090 RepID=Q7UEF1_RHOBA|nr:restriction endonuclease subunit S [Rhodopirellula baltica]CAD79085.1 probable HsdS polypeptide, part of CfrA family [Rhodopirellula baltica SH 1]HBE62188.1 restriction endonuclease subunit S [Rhodopirellula baltica]
MSWKSAPLEDVADFRLGKMLDAKKNRGELMPYLANVNVRWGEFDLTDLREMRFEEHEVEKFELRSGDIVMCEGGEPGRCAIWKNQCENMMIQKAIHRIRPHDCLDNRFLFYSFVDLGKRGVLSGFFTGSTIKHLPREKLALVHVPVPPIDVQQRIADVLSGYDDLIENNRRRMELLEASARQLHEEWFVRLRFPGHEHAHFANGVPNGWEQQTIAELVEAGELELQTGPFGTQLKASDYTDVGAPVINVRNIGLGSVRPDKLEFVPEEVAERLHKHVLASGDIVFGRKGAVDRHVLIRSMQHGWVQGSDCIRMRSNSERISTTLMSLAFRDERHKEWMLTQCSNKATMASLNQEVLGRIEVLIPSSNIRKIFLEMASTIFAQMDNLESQNERLVAGRSHLLPRLMSGEIPV